MSYVFLFWFGSSLILMLAAWRMGKVAKNKDLGIFIDKRDRFSLSQFQMVLWTIIILSLLSGVFFGRLVAGVENPLAINIPDELLILMGISVGSTATANAIKVSKDSRNVPIIKKEATFSQTYLVEEGSVPETVDISKWQNLWLTFIVVVAYIFAAVVYIKSKMTDTELNSLPGFDNTLLILLGISHAGYIAGKLPDRK